MKRNRFFIVKRRYSYITTFTSINSRDDGGSHLMNAFFPSANANSPGQKFKLLFDPRASLSSIKMKKSTNDTTIEGSIRYEISRVPSRSQRQRKNVGTADYRGNTRQIITLSIFFSFWSIVGLLAAWQVKIDPKDAAKTALATKFL